MVVVILKWINKTFTVLISNMVSIDQYNPYKQKLSGVLNF